MSALVNGYITLANLELILKTVKAKGEKGFAFTASLSDESKAFENNGKTSYQNASFYAEQTKEQREAKAKRFYFANGGVFWTDGFISVAGGTPTKQPAAAPQKQTAPAAAPAGPVDDLPF